MAQSLSSDDEKDTITVEQFAAYFAMAYPGVDMTPTQKALSVLLVEMATEPTPPLMVFVQPRCGSTMLLATWATFYALHNPTERVAVSGATPMLTGYYKQMCTAVQDDLGLSPFRDSIVKYPVGTSMSGRGVNMMFVDRPFVSPEDMSKLFYRERIVSWLGDDVFTRILSNKHGFHQFLLLLPHFHPEGMKDVEMYEAAEQLGKAIALDAKERGATWDKVEISTHGGMLREIVGHAEEEIA